MGRMKELLLMAEMSGLNLALLDKHVCKQCCFDDEHVKAMVAEIGSEEVRCSYCGQSGAANCHRVMAWVMDFITVEWSDAPREHGAGYDSETGDYMVRKMVSDAESVLAAVGLTEQNECFWQDAITSMSPEWCRRIGWSLSRDEELRYGWEDFSERAKQISSDKVEAMFRNWPHCNIPDEPEHSDTAKFAEVVAEVGDEVMKYAKTRILKRGDILYRARAGLHKDESALLAPPPSLACASRMSPAGISMLYGSADPKTAICEIADKVSDALTIGKFRIVEDAPVLDLSDLPYPPSFFGARAGSREQIMFLWKFAEHIARAANRDGGEFREYTPTQIFAAHVAANGAHDGIVYYSAQNKGGKCYAIFPYISREGDKKKLRLETAAQCQKDPHGEWRKI